MVPPPPILSPRPRKSSVIRIVLAAVLLAACGVAIVPSLYIEEKIRGKMQWERYEAVAKGRGAKLEFADFIPPKIPDAENFASIPIFEAAFRASDDGREIPNPFELRKPAKGELPKFSDPVKQVPIDLVSWQRYFVDVKLLPATSDNAAADTLKALNAFADPLGQLSLAASRPHCHFPVHWERGPAAALPQYGLLQSAAKLYALRLDAHLALGDSANAYKDFHEGMRLVTATAYEPAMITGLVRISMAVILQNAVWNGLASHQWAEPDLRKIEADIAALDWLKDYVWTVSSERAGTNLLTDMVIKDSHLLDDLSQKNDYKANAVVALYPVGWLYQNKVRLNLFFDELLARVDPEARRFHSEHSIRSSSRNIKSSFEKLHYALFMVVTPVFEDAERHFIHAAAMADQTRLSCAVERFRLKRGSVPGSLDKLAPEFVSQLPLEVVNGEPYHYRLTENGGFVLYSVGKNLRDDGGLIDPKRKASDQLDWVWRYPAR